jgi:hypothetical protein
MHGKVKNGLPLHGKVTKVIDIIVTAIQDMSKD